ncbi:MerR family transcriptional regulator [Paenibacillus sp. GCM10027628]|uniref:MerR family transcriptional regulator n=1 Tax=Paenibacillus sp. GCM10027628 TaxID=3273413 RepID=UPI00363FD880
MKISQLSKSTGVSARSIRHYEKKKLITSMRLDNDYREFDESAVERIRNVQVYLSLGMTTNEIEQVLSCKDSNSAKNGYCDDMLKAYEDKLEKINSQLNSLATLQHRLEKQIRIMKKKRERLGIVT